MRTALSITIAFLLVFFVMSLVAFNSEPRMPGVQAVTMALEWTLRLFGGITATASAVGMLIIAAGHGPFQRQVMLAMPLLAGLLLISANWGLALAFGAIATIWIFRFGSMEIERTSAAPPGGNL